MQVAHRSLQLVATAVGLLAAAPAPPASVTTETEPNNTWASANLAAAGDTIGGTLDSYYDLDYFAFDVAAGSLLLLDLEPAVAGSYPYLYLSLLDRDGVTVLAYNYYYYSGYPSHIQLAVPVTGRYFAVVSGSGSYRLRINAQPPAPGDPSTILADSLGIPSGLAAAPTGELFVASRSQTTYVTTLVRIQADGSSDVFASLPTSAQVYDLVADTRGDLLLAGQYSNNGVIWRVSRETRLRTQFTDRAHSPTAITMGPDGDVWVADGGYWLLRFDPHGVLRDSIRLNYVGPIVHLAFSPAGELYLSSEAGLYKVVSRQAKSVGELGGSLGRFAFDQDGYLYMIDTHRQEVFLVDPSSAPVHVPFARTNLGQSMYLAFGRTAAGAMTSRLFVASARWVQQEYRYRGLVAELNAAGVRAQGWRIGVNFLVATSALRDGLVGADYNDTLRTESGAPAVTWSIASGALAPGLSLDRATGIVTGVPEAAGMYRFTARAASSGDATLRELAVTVREPELRVTDAMDALLGVQGVLTPALERFLDLKGNTNGRFDVGDLQAYLRAKGKLPQAPPSAAPGKEGT